MGQFGQYHNCAGRNPTGWCQNSRVATFSDMVPAITGRFTTPKFDHCLLVTATINVDYFYAVERAGWMQVN
jgi:hypothetical protein